VGGKVRVTSFEQSWSATETDYGKVPKFSLHFGVISKRRSHFTKWRPARITEQRKVSTPEVKAGINQ